MRGELFFSPLQRLWDAYEKGWNSTGAEPIMKLYPNTVFLREDGLHAQSTVALYFAPHAQGNRVGLKFAARG